MPDLCSQNAGNGHESHHVVGINRQPAAPDFRCQRQIPRDEREAHEQAERRQVESANMNKGEQFYFLGG